MVKPLLNIVEQDSECYKHLAKVVDVTGTIKYIAWSENANTYAIKFNDLSIVYINITSLLWVDPAWWPQHTRKVGDKASHNQVRQHNS